MRKFFGTLIASICLIVLTGSSAPFHHEFNEWRNSEFGISMNEEIEAEVEYKVTDFEVNGSEPEVKKEEVESAEKKTFIKWVDFNVTAEVLKATCNAGVKLYNEGKTEYGVCELLAFLALKNGNKFSSRDVGVLNKLVKELQDGNDSAIAKYKENKYYKYYVESYHAVLDGIIDENGIKGYFPLAKGYWYSGYDDFGNSRGYGFKRRHLGHDMFGGTGTPIIAVEGGTVTELGWNQYGGWRVGIRSDDTKRYYYYAHLRKGRPFAEGLKLGDTVKAGQVIGYLGITGYSRKKDTNITTTKPHLHFGMQIIFDKSQEDGNGEIWVDVYEICKFLSKNRMAVKKNAETKEYTAVG